MEFATTAIVPCKLRLGSAQPSNQVVVCNGSCEEFPCTVVVADVGDAARLGDTAVGVEVSVSYV